MSDDRLLRRLKSPNTREHNDAIGEVNDRVKAAAVRQLGDKVGRADQRVSSIAQVVLMKHLPRIRDQAPDDQGLWLALFGQVKRLVVDIARKPAVRKGAVPIGGTDAYEPEASARSVRSEAGSRESAAASARAFRSGKLRDAIARAQLSPRDEDLIWLYMCEGKRGDEVAAALGMRAGAVRKRAHDLRGKVATEVVRALRVELTAEEREIAELRFVVGRTAQEIAESRDCPAKSVEDKMKSTVLAAKRMFGSKGLTFLKACVHAKKQKSKE